MSVQVRPCRCIGATLRLALGLLVGCVPPAAVAGATFTVNSPADVVDATPGDGFCRTAPNNTVCTLRAAIMEANALPGADTINLQANVTYLLGRVGVDDTGESGDLDILDSVTIVGAGPASTIIDGNGAATGDKVMQVVQCIGNATPMMGCSTGDVVVEVSGVAFRNGRATIGGAGGIENRGALTLENCAVTDSTGTITNGGILSVGGSVTLSNSTVANNIGGGLNLTAATVTITASTISGNHSVGSGGGIFANSSTLILINTTISGNFSDSSGGGLAVSVGTAGLYNVTIAGNTANADDTGVGTGGGMFDQNGASVTLANSIVSGNIHKNDGSLFDSVDDCSGSFTSQGNNLVTAVLCTIAGPNSTASPFLGPLQNNGGPTLTQALLTGSAAIDGGNAAGCTDDLGAPIDTDQRGEPRPFGSACDIGAFERGSLIFRDGFEQ